MDRGTWHRNRARRSRSGCLDLSHRHADLTCPFCSDRGDVLIEQVIRQQARTAAEDAAGFGWSS